jgi:large subunit ribosomal protein L31
MKKDIHPKEYRSVIFEDVTAGRRFLIGSTISSGKTDKWAKADEDGSPGQKGLGTIGKEYPLVQVEISSASHPFYTGNAKIVDTAGRVEKFKQRRAAAKPTTKKKTK